MNRMPETPKQNQEGEHPLLTELKNQGTERLQKVYQDSKANTIEKLVVKTIMNSYLYDAIRLLTTNGISLLIEHLKVCRDCSQSIELHHNKQENQE